MSRIFSFFCALAVKKLRVILKARDWGQCSKKDVLVAKAMLHLTISQLSGKPLDEILSAHAETARFQSWLVMKLSKDETYPVSINRVPDEDVFVRLLPVPEASEYKRKKISIDRARSGPQAQVGTVVNETDVTPAPSEAQNERYQINLESNEPSDSTQFGINELARFLITMRDDDDARAAVIAMGQDLDRAQLDAGVTRRDFWAVVASRFLNMTGAVDGVDSRLTPLVHRLATFLKDKFNDSKVDFTVYVTRWSASGQNDPDRFRNFLPTLANGEFSALGKRMMVMFVCTRKGTPCEEEHFSNICCKMIPGGAGRDEGSQNGCTIGEGDSNWKNRKKRGPPESEGIKDIGSSLSKLKLRKNEGKRVDKDPDGSERLLKYFPCRLKKIKPLEDVQNKLSVYPPSGEGSVAVALRKLEQEVCHDLLSDEDERDQSQAASQ